MTKKLTDYTLEEIDEYWTARIDIEMENINKEVDEQLRKRMLFKVELLEIMKKYDVKAVFFKVRGLYHDRMILSRTEHDALLNELSILQTEIEKDLRKPIRPNQKEKGSRENYFG